MVVIGTTELSVTLIADRLQLRLVQLLLSGKSMSECVSKIGTDYNWGSMTVEDGLILAKQFALGLQPILGLVKAPTILEAFAPTAETPKN
jgi:hypothetical protein